MDGIVTHLTDDHVVIAAMTELGATSPINACPHKALPSVIQAQLPLLLDRGIVREGRPGYYYLYIPQAVRSVSPRKMVRRILVAAGFWLFIVLLPFLLMYIFDQ
jgi:hypothetical protein